MTLGNLIGQRLRYLREQRGVSLRSASSDAGVSITWLCRLENGKISDPKLSGVERLAKFYDVPLKDLVDAETTQS